MSGGYVPPSLRARVAEQARHRCGYCLTTEAIVGCSLEIEHILPRARGGPTAEANLWLACSPCNDHKGNRIAAVDPDSGIHTPLFDPRRDAWHEHFAWAPAGDYIVGLTPVGRATVRALRLNRPVLVAARRLWVRAGWHPPPD